MKIRQAGHRVRRVRTGQCNRGSRDAGRRRAKDRPLSSRERQHLLQLVICGSIFVLLVAVKLFLPGNMVAINQRLSGALEQDMDVESVFRAVGRAFSGEEDVEAAAEEVYRAVFRPEDEAVEVSGPARLKADLPSALETLQENRVKSDEAPVEMEESVSLAYVLYSDENLPECVSLDESQRNTRNRFSCQLGIGSCK